MPRHIRKGDTVVVTAGNDRGVVGEVMKVIPDEDRVVVKGVNIRTKHVRQTPNRQQSGRLKAEMPIHISNVSPAVDGKPTRVRFETKADGSKVRVAVRDGSELHTLSRPRKERKKGSGKPATL